MSEGQSEDQGEDNGGDEDKNNDNFQNKELISFLTLSFFKNKSNYYDYLIDINYVLFVQSQLPMFNLKYVTVMILPI